MSRWFFALILSLACSAGASGFSNEIRASFDAGDPVPTEIFKIRDGVEVHYFAPATPRVPGNNVAHFYIHGGGWRGGNPTGTYRWARYLAEHGVSAFTLKYRLSSEKKGTKPTICLEDAKSGMRWIRANAEQLGIDPERIAVSGNSAGGHLSAALATIEGYNHPSDDLSVNTVPNLLLLGSPVLDNGPEDVPWLLDLKVDPNELVNGYANPENQPEVDRLMKALADYAEATGETWPWRTWASNK